MYTAHGQLDRDALIRQHAPLVRRIAQHMIAKLPPNVELDDLIQVGMIGLADALSRYEASQGVQFETFAGQRIRGAMLDELRGQDWLPRSVRAKARKIEQAIQVLEQRLMRAPSEAEIAQQMEMPLDEYQTLLHDAQGVQIVHYEDFATEPDTTSGQSDWAATLNHGTAGGNPLDSLLAGDFRQALIHAIDTLPDREKLLLSLCYEQGLNLKEIGAIMNVTEARVCQLRSQATARIRAKLREQAWQQLPQEGQIAQII